MKKAAIGWVMIIAGVAILAAIFWPKTGTAPTAVVETRQPATSTPSTKTTGPAVIINGSIVHVEIADTDALREQGLSDRTSLAENTGMLFVFDQPVVPGFWMKDMHFPLDIIWISADSTIEGVEKNLSPDTYPKPFAPAAPVKYVLEVNAGYFDTHSLKVGMQVRQVL